MIVTLGFAIAAAGASAYAAHLRRRLRTDQLTGLGNRLALHEAVARCRRRRVAVLLLDLDGFKPINDTFGHRCGDAVLVEVARRLRAHQRCGRLAVRLSGDEFAFWISDATDDREVERLRRDIARSIATPMTVEGQVLRVSASIGAAVTDGRPARLDALLETADKAMYRDKARRSAHHRLPVPDARPSVRRREVVA